MDEEIKIRQKKLLRRHMSVEAAVTTIVIRGCMLTPANMIVHGDRSKTSHTHTRTHTPGLGLGSWLPLVERIGGGTCRHVDLLNWGQSDGNQAAGRR
jgi:hypothetical protein